MAAGKRQFRRELNSWGPQPLDRGMLVEPLGKRSRRVGLPTGPVAERTCAMTGDPRLRGCREFRWRRLTGTTRSTRPKILDSLRIKFGRIDPTPGECVNPKWPNLDGLK